MANFDVMDVDIESIHDYKDKLARIENLLVATNKEIDRFIRKYSYNGIDTQY